MTEQPRSASTDGESCTVLGDWGTTRLRLFLTAAAVVHERCEGPGIGALTVPPIQALRSTLAPWLARRRLTRIVLCGMAGSRNGLSEVPYLPLPAALEDWRRHLHACGDGDLDISIAPGLSAVDAGIGDVMRGEETQIFGAVRCDPQLAAGRHRLVLPGTHSKWVSLHNGVIVGFRTHITGELFALLRDRSTLLRVGGAGDASGGFETGLERGRTCGPGLAAALFETRSAQLLQERSPAWAREFLSGLLIGAEVHAAVTDAHAVDSTRLIGDPLLTARYQRALVRYGVASVEMDGDDCVIAGLRLLTGERYADR